MKRKVLNVAALAICMMGSSLSVSGQSTDQSFPTAVTTNEITGTIKARDIGDSRLTSYFYTFDGGQGDLFINVVTKNLNGDIDVFAADGLRPLTKMVVYSDASESETGRLVYLRKPERLILRVEGRSPNDDPATFRIKFAGSFIALAEQKEQDSPTIARREIDAESGIRVNSVGTIVEVIPKPQPTPKATPETVEADNSKEPDFAKTAAVKTVETKKPAAAAKSKKKPDSTTAAVKTPADKNSEEKKEAASAKKPAKRNESAEVKTVFKKTIKPKNETSAITPKPTEPTVPDPMAGIRLIVQLKEGKTIERPMNEVRTFRVDKGVLTVTATDGRTVIYSMSDVAKVTIE